MWHLTCRTLSSAGTVVLEHLKGRWGGAPPTALWSFSSPPWVLPPTFGGDHPPPCQGWPKAAPAVTPACPL